MNKEFYVVDINDKKYQGDALHLTNGFAYIKNPMQWNYFSKLWETMNIATLCLSLRHIIAIGYYKKPSND